MWIVELEKGVFIDQGRVTTLRQMFEKRFKNEKITHNTSMHCRHGVRQHY